MLFETFSGITCLEYKSKIISESSKFTPQNRNIALHKAPISVGFLQGLVIFFWFLQYFV